MKAGDLLTLFSDGRRIGVDQGTIVAILLLQLAASAFELLGVVSFVPIFQLLSANGDTTALVRDYAHWRVLTEVANRLQWPLGLSFLLCVTMVMFLVRQALSLARALYEAQARERTTAELRGELFRRFLRASTDYQDQASSGGMVADLTFNTTQAAGHVFGRMALSTQLVICAVYIGGMFWLSPLLTLLLVGVVAILLLVAAPHVARARGQGREVVEAAKGVSEFVVERLKLARLVRISRMEEPEAGTITQLTRRQGEANVRVWRSLSLVDSTLETMAMGFGLLIVYLAISQFGLTIEFVGIFLAMLTRLVPVVRQVVKMKQAADAARAAYDSVVGRLADLARHRETSSGSIELAKPQHVLALENVDYTYPTRTDLPALRNISLQLPVGKMTAIVGPSGAGKSTLIDLLPRLRAPTAGRIRIDDNDIATFETGSLRRAIAYLAQRPLIFNVPLREHIAYGTPGASLEAIERAARLSGIHATIAALPEGYDTLAGEGGNRLSGGQRQRLDLARALLSKASILILDEPAASLDGESAHQLMLAIERIRRETDTTIILISHHLPSIRTADQIVVLRAGQIEAIGRHDDLMRTEGWYAATWRAQTTETEPAVAPAA